MTVASVYWIRCQDHTDMMSQGYIGVSKNAERRFVEHSRSKQNRHLSFAIQKHGWDNLVKTQILIASEDYCLEIERKLRPTDGVGWNLVVGGGIPPKGIGNKHRLGKASWNKGKKMSAEMRAKVSKAVTDAMKDPVRREINRQTFLGKPSKRKGVKHTPESIEKMRLAHTGTVSKKKGKLLTDAQKARLSEMLRKNPWTCPHCQTVGYNKGAGNRWHFDNCKEIVL